MHVASVPGKLETSEFQHTAVSFKSVEFQSKLSRNICITRVNCPEMSALRESIGSIIQPY